MHTQTHTHTHPSPTTDWWSWKSKIHLSLLYSPAGFSMAWLAYHPAPRRSAHVGSLPEPHHPVLSLTYGHTQTLRHSWTDFQATPAPPPSSYWPVGRGHVAGWNASQCWALALTDLLVCLPENYQPGTADRNRQEGVLFSTLTAALTLSSKIPSAPGHGCTGHWRRSVFLLLVLYCSFGVAHSWALLLTLLRTSTSVNVNISNGQKMCIYAPNLNFYLQPEPPLYQWIVSSRSYWMQLGCSLHIN